MTEKNKQMEAIYQAYFDDVYRFLLRLSGNEYIAQEVTAQTFFQAMNHLEQFRGSCQMQSWLCQIAKNTYYSYPRKHKHEVNEIAYDYEAPVHLEQMLLEKETSMELHEILHTISEPYKEVFMLRVFGELSFKQIGHLFAKTENWACVTYHRARKIIIQRLGEEK